MRTKMSVLGHPLHQMLVPIPLGLFVLAIILDIVYMANPDLVVTSISFWNLVAGIIGAGAAAIFGAIDLYFLPRKTRAFRIGLVHGAGNLCVTLFFFIAVLLRMNNVAHVPTAASFSLELLAAVTALAAAWLGGELVNRFGVGVDDHAHLDAPGSLPELRRRVTPHSPQFETRFNQ